MDRFYVKDYIDYIVLFIYKLFLYICMIYWIIILIFFNIIYIICIIYFDVVYILVFDLDFELVVREVLF